MRLTKTNFSSPAVTVGLNHYFPDVNDLNNMVDGKVKMAVCYYSHSRRKWLSDTAYITVDKAKSIINYAKKRGVLSGVDEKQTNSSDVCEQIIKHQNKI